MVIAITGSRGLLGSYLIKTQPKEGFDGMGASNRHQIIELPREVLDVSNFAKMIDVLFKTQPDIIIHCAANGDVDDVERNSSEAVQTDLLGVINLKNYCEKMRCKLITLSSNAVYDGDNPPYNEYSPRKPINFYGKIKSLADDIIIKSSCDWLIVRPILMYGWGEVRDNWVTTIVKKLKKGWVNTIVGELEGGKMLNLVTDYYTQPTYAADIAEAIWFLIERDKWHETYNIGTSEIASIYEFGMSVCDEFGLDKDLISEAKLSDFTSIAPRPLNTCFDVAKINSLGFTCRGIKEGLKAMRNEET